MKRRTKIFLLIITVLGVFLIYLFSITKMNEPIHRQIPDNELCAENVNDSLVLCDDSWLKLNKFGMWELYVQGDPYTMGLKNGRLTKDLVRYQEEAFVGQIDQLIPSRSYLLFLRVFLGWFNREYQNRHQMSLTISHHLFNGL
jgi:isopenicillin-N N-acyltransferase-like protein